VIKILYSAVKHPYPPIKVGGYNSILATDRTKRSGRFTGTKYLEPWKLAENFHIISRTESFTYSTSMNYNLLRIACCTISAVLNEKGEKRPEVIARCLKYCIRIQSSLSLAKGSYSRLRNSSLVLGKTRIDRSLKRVLTSHAICIESHDPHYSGCTYVCMYVRQVSFT